MAVYKDFTFRLDAECEGVRGATHERVRQFLQSLNCAHVVAYELSDEKKKWHYQGWVRHSMSYQKWTSLIKETWPDVIGSGRGRRGTTTGKYSGAEVRKESYYDYVLKGTASCEAEVVSYLLPPGQILDLTGAHRRWWSYQAAALEKKVTIVEEGITVFRDCLELSSDDMHHNRTLVATWLVNKHLGKGMNSFLYKNYINGILCGVSQEYKALYIRQLAETDRW